MPRTNILQIDLDIDITRYGFYVGTIASIQKTDANPEVLIEEDQFDVEMWSDTGFMMLEGIRLAGAELGRCDMRVNRVEQTWTGMDRQTDKERISQLMTLVRRHAQIDDLGDEDRWPDDWPSSIRGARTGLYQRDKNGVDLPRHLPRGPSV